MTEPVYFVVEQRRGVEYPTMHHGYLQPCAAVYVLRLDRLPNPERWLAMPLAELYAQYTRLRDAGTLPAPNAADPPKKADAAKRLTGDYWEPPARTWPDRPADPWGAKGEIMVDGKLQPAEGGKA